MQASPTPATWKTISAFAILYLVWGSTFFAIRVGVLAMPPLLFGAIRFFIAGVLLTGFMLARKTRLPTRPQWLSVLLIAFFIFVADYGLMFWAEQHVPSGLSAVIMATTPAFMALAEILFLGTQRLTVRLAIALVIGLGGVGVLMSRGMHLGGTPVDTRGALALIAASLFWAIAAALSRKLPLPESKPLNAGLQMLVGGLMLTLISASLGEFSRFHPHTVSRGAWFALLYLIVFGSLVGFTAYVWLIHHQSPTRVGTYAYVNPVVAVFLGYLLGGEALGARTILGTLFILVSVIVITTTRAAQPVLTSAAEEA